MVPSRSSAPKRSAICATSRPIEHPVGLDVRDVVEHQAADRERLAGRRTRSARAAFEAVVLVVERERDEALKAARSRPAARAAAAGDRRGARRSRCGRRAWCSWCCIPSRCATRCTSRYCSAVGLALGDPAPHVRMEDLGAAARHAVEARLAQTLEHLAVGHAELLGEVVDLHAGEALEVDAGAHALPAARAAPRTTRRADSG